MYQILYGNDVIYDPRCADENLILSEAVLHQSCNAAGSLTMKIPTDNPYIRSIKKMQGKISVIHDGVVRFRGRVLSSSFDFYNQQQITVEGEMAYLNDSYMPPYSYPEDVADANLSENVVDCFLGWVLDTHNAQVTNDRKIYKGTVTVTDSNNYISRSCKEYSTCMETIKGKLLDTLGGYLLPRYEQDGAYLDYYAELPLTNTQRVEAGVNLLDFSRQVDGSQIYTQILPIGKDGVTIGELVDGDINTDLVKAGNIIYSRSGRMAYGNITKIFVWQDVTLPQNLKTKAAESLSSVGLGIPETITCSAVDLSFTDEEVASFVVGRNTIFVSNIHGVSEMYTLDKMDTDILDISNTRITLGATRRTYTEEKGKDKRENERRAQEQQLELEKISETVDTLPQFTTEEITRAVQNSQSIILSAQGSYVKKTEFEIYKEDKESELLIQNNSITAGFTSSSERINDVNGDLQSKWQELTTKIKLSIDGVAIDTGRQALSIDGGSIKMISDNQIISQWVGRDFYAGNIIVELDQRAQIGSFAFTPRTNGNVSLKKMK